jgi:kinesin family protein 1
MNNNSSRAHTIFQIVLTQTFIDKAKGNASDKVSKISLVDLAGSEKSKDTGATGDRLKEGSAINKSLSALGNVIAALVKRGNLKGKKAKEVFIPYRDSVLTWLIKESLGGNARTIMIAALSPADTNYAETLSTLQYANRAKQIQNKAVVNEDPNERMIKELKAEVEALRKQLVGSSTPGETQDLSAMKEMERLKEQLMESQKIIQSLQMSDEEKNEKDQKIFHERDEMLRNAGLLGNREAGEVQMDAPYLTNLNPDHVMNETLVFYLKKGQTTIGRRTKESNPDIPLGGVKILPQHCIIENNDDGKIIITPSSNDAAVFIDGKRITAATTLSHFSRIIFGSNHTFKLIDPKGESKMTEEDKKKKVPQTQVDYYFAQRELAEQQGITDIIDNSNSNAPKDNELNEKMRLLQEQIEKEKEEKQRSLEEQKKRLVSAKRRMEQEYKKKEQELLELASQKEASKVKELKVELEKKQREGEESLKRQTQEIEVKKAALDEEVRRQRELAQKFEAKQHRDKQNRSHLEEKLIKLIPMVTEANAIATEMDRPVSMTVKLIAYLYEDGDVSETRTDIGVKVVDTATNRSYIWSYEKFQNRFFIIQEMYNNFCYSREEGRDFQIDNESDPLWDPDEEQSRILGISVLYMRPLVHMVDVVGLWTPIITNKGEGNCGELLVSLEPCERDGAVIKDQYVADPASLIGESLYFKLTVEAARGIPADKTTDVYVRFKIPALKETEFTSTQKSSKRTVCPTFSFTKIYRIPVVTRELIDYMTTSAIKFELFARPNDLLRPISVTASRSRAGSVNSNTLGVPSLNIIKRHQDNILATPMSIPINEDTTYGDLFREGEAMVNKMAADNQIMRHQVTELMNSRTTEQMRVFTLEDERVKLQKEIEMLQQRLTLTEKSLSDLPPVTPNDNESAHVRRATMQIDSLTKLLEEEKKENQKRVEEVERSNKERLDVLEKRYQQKQEEAQVALQRVNEVESAMEQAKATGVMQTLNVYQRNMHTPMTPLMETSHGSLSYNVSDTDEVKPIVKVDDQGNLIVKGSVEGSQACLIQ